MKVRLGSVSLLTALLFGSAGVAAADENDDMAPSFDRALDAPSHAFELTIGATYGFGTGDISSGGARIQDVSGGAATVELKAAYRWSSFALGAYGSFTHFSAGDNLASGTSVRGATAGLFVDWHFRADRSTDPWIGLSSGWRGLWLSPDTGKTSGFQGWEIARFSAGIDYRITRAVAMGPFLGFSVDTFLTENTPDTDGYRSIDGPRPDFFFFAGLQGRFDIGGGHAAAPIRVEQARN